MGTKPKAHSAFACEFSHAPHGKLTYYTYTTLCNNIERKGRQFMRLSARTRGTAHECLSFRHLLIRKLHKLLVLRLGVSFGIAEELACSFGIPLLKVDISVLTHDEFLIIL